MDQFGTSSRITDSIDVIPAVIRRKMTEADITRFQAIIAKSFNRQRSEDWNELTSEERLQVYRDMIKPSEIIVSWNSRYIYFKINKNKMSPWRRQELDEGGDNVILYRLPRFDPDKKTVNMYTGKSLDPDYAGPSKEHIIDDNDIPQPAAPSVPVVVKLPQPSSTQGIPQASDYRPQMGSVQVSNLPPVAGQPQYMNPQQMYRAQQAAAVQRAAKK